MTSNSQFKSAVTSCRTDCEFCLELSNIALSRFGITYGGVADSRLIDQRDGFVVIPTLGQLFTGSLLVLPQAHFETTAEMSSQQIHAALQIIEEYAEQLRQFGKVVVFEHGSRATEGLACGIHHAHVHVVPVPGDLSLDEALTTVTQEVESLTSAYDALSAEVAYLLFRDTERGQSRRFAYCSHWAERRQYAA
jgi:diadenosine tetraphosphate (Ap4A) HIT family hydrolase